MTHVMHVIQNIYKYMCVIYCICLYVYTYMYVYETSEACEVCAYSQIFFSLPSSVKTCDTSTFFMP